MLKDGRFKKVIIICGRVDMRKGIVGLAALIALKYGLNPTDKGTLFLCCGNKKNVIKGLEWEGDGFACVTKKLANGTYCWPRTPEEAREITREQFDRLMSGFTIESSIK
ncbi:MAG: IS66 family insertion sequence element accessory protein TnpB [Aeriscardovia sp.]|nr:IS66 family insertion sequence element accessory protein TnpB [Aeriscardovia sp.]